MKILLPLLHSTVSLHHYILCWLLFHRKSYIYRSCGVATTEIMHGVQEKKGSLHALGFS
jgi:hypothetical protein